MDQPLIPLALRQDSLAWYGKVTSVTDATHCVIDSFAGHGDNRFKDWYLYVIRDAGGAGAAPQDELAKVTDYVSATGTFTHIAFTASLAATDEVLVVHKSVAMGTNYFEQIVPLGMNLTQTLNNTAGDKDFIAANIRGASGLISTDDSKVQKVFLILLGVAVNTYAGTNALDCTTATHNQLQIDLDNGGFSDLVNGVNPDGQLLDNDWRCPVEGAIHSFAFQFDVTDQITNIDGNIGIRLENGRAEQTSLIVTMSAYLRILWRL